MTREINLYNPALAPRVELFSGQVMLFGLAGVLGVCLVAWMASDYRAGRAAQREAAQAAQLAQVQGEVARLTSQAAQRSSDPAVRDALARVEALLTQRSQVLATLDSGVLGDTGVSPNTFGRSPVRR